MQRSYVFVDGSALLGDIRRLHDTGEPFVGKQLQLDRVVRMFLRGGMIDRKQNLGQYGKAAALRDAFTDVEWRRFVFYFVEGDDERIKRLTVRDDPAQPGVVRDYGIQRCGRRQTQLEKAHEWLLAKNAPQHVHDCLHRTEKAVDTQICCDALELAARNAIDRLFLYTNDSDFVPLFRTLRGLGTNVNLLRLSTKCGTINSELVDEYDGLHVLDDDALQHCFGLIV
jgi:uncharacterized LabA/DUF88 family protein